LNGLGIHYRKSATPPPPPGSSTHQARRCANRTRPLTGRWPGRSLWSSSSPATSRHTVPPDLVGKELDVAETELETLHVKYHEIDAAHYAFGILEPSNWTVCQTYPRAGQR
jgi:hypothetical protein